ncbi:hypothetical protein GSY69_08215 [Brevibacterium sp. 5221]|uniref:Uncharacterized protein n=1 Tax=Brevibacterium rongguiense TaxID=2695267 RepID=A0A6N9H8X2_9MICO|nr:MULTISPECIES: hypothetical protein [Brevibacterium]MYM19952.1 hypothetical protein [Brevibacterium rongguiense]WAL41022.1 hypothetical protein BRM1_03925 [Brevibacterium sp. BRM-1]
MSAATSLDGSDTDIALDGGGGPGCAWTEAVCTAAPTHFLTLPVPGGESSTALLCRRHWLASLAYRIEVTMEVHPVAFDDLVLDYGEL